jgi:phosphoribosylamine--glycine ligase
MSKFLIVSKSGDELGLAHRLHLEGHEVKFFLADKDGPHLYEGILPRVADWETAASKDTVLVFGMVGLGKKADEFKAKGFKVVGGSVLGDQLELDRMFGLSVAENHDIAVPESEDFQDFGKGIEYLSEQDDDTGFVFKPEHNKEGVRTFVASSTEQMVAMLEHAKEVWKGKVDFVLQKVVDGVEISSEIWCVNGNVVPGSYNNTLEQKRFLNGNLGPNTGCMGSTVKFNLCPRLYDETFAKLKPWLKQVKFNGPLDINCIIDADGTPFMLEWTARFGYSAVYAMLEGINMPLGEFLSALASGAVPSLQPKDQWCGALRLTMPPYPHVENAPECEGLPIIGLDMESEHVWPLDVMERDGKILCSGFDGIVCELSDSADDLDNLWGQLFDSAKQLQVPEMQMRTDICMDVQQRVDELIDLGYADSAEALEGSE